MNERHVRAVFSQMSGLSGRPTIAFGLFARLSGKSDILYSGMNNTVRRLWALSSGLSAKDVLAHSELTKQTIAEHSFIRRNISLSKLMSSSS